MKSYNLYRIYHTWILNDLSRNSCVDAIKIKLTATDDGDVTCKEQGQTSCKSASLNLNLRIRETNKPPFCSKTTSGSGTSCRELFETENDRTLGSIPEYSASEVTFDDQNKEWLAFSSSYVIVMSHKKCLIIYDSFWKRFC